MNQALRILRDRADIAAIVGILLGVQFFPRFDVFEQPGILGLGVVAGAALALHAIGIILVYRTNRIINFAQIQVGATAAVLFVTMVNYRPLLRGLSAICPPCVERVTPGLNTANYLISMVLALALSLLLTFLVYVFVVKRFAQAPKLVLTVATIFVAQLLAGLAAWIPDQLTTEAQRDAGLRLGPAGTPFNFSLSIKPAEFQAPDILTVMAVVVAAGVLGVYFRRSSTGIAIRAAAENPARVASLGVNVDAVTSRVWMISGLLSGVAGILLAMAQGAPGGGDVSLSVGTLIRILAVAVIARMSSLWIASFAAVSLGILESAFQWSFGSVTMLEGLFLLVIGGVLVLQRRQVSRAEVESASAWRAAPQTRPIPSELRSLPVVRSWVRNLRVAGVVVFLGLPWIMSPSQNNLASVILIFAMVALSLLVLTGWAGQISLGQFAFAAIGGYVAARFILPFPLPLIMSGIVGAVAAVAVGLPALKLRGLHLAIMTLAFALSTTAILLNPSYLGSALPDTLDRPTLIGMQLEDERIFYYLTLAILCLVIAAIAGLRSSRTARALIAARDNEPAAQSFGINLTRARLSAFAISGFIAAVAGALFAWHQHGVRVQAFEPERGVTMFLIAVIGGLGSIAAPLLGAAYYGVQVIFGWSPVVQNILTGGGGLLVLIALPGGIGQGVFGIRDAVLRRVAKRHRIVVASLVADVKTADGTMEEVSPIAPKMRQGGGSVFVPERYRLPMQWALTPPNGSERTRTEEVTGG